jgi:hypothetical protein
MGRTALAYHSRLPDGAPNRPEQAAMVTLQVAITRMSAAELAEAGRVLGAAFVSSPLERAVRGTIDNRQRPRLGARVHGDVSLARPGVGGIERRPDRRGDPLGGIPSLSAPMEPEARDGADRDLGIRPQPPEGDAVGGGVVDA